MGHLRAELPATPWAPRLLLPAYQVAEAARYAGISASTVTAWHNSAKASRALLNARSHRAALSYLQLIEVAVVAALREQKVPLKRIREAREYMANILKADYPFARYSFKTDGRRLWMDYSQVIGRKKGKGKLLSLNENGQLAWDAIIGGRLRDFEYDGTGIVIKWNVAGPDSRVFIDPRVSFGAPVVEGIPTWILAGRRKAGERVTEIAEDFGIETESVLSALQFEGLPFDDSSNVTWIS